MQPPEEIGISAQGSLRLRRAGKVTVLSGELLRTHSPSAEVKGHGGERKLVTGKADVRVTDIDLTGWYGIRLTFSDGHDSGIFTWEYLDELCRNRKALLQAYRRRLTEEQPS